MPEPHEAAADTPMLADIRRQPDVLAALLAREAEVTAFGAAHLRATRGGRVWVFGSGDGWFAARAALTRAAIGQAASGLDFVVNVAPQLGPDDRALAISMSGNVDRTLEGATVARAAGAGVSVLTNEGGGRLGALGIVRLSLRIADVAPFLCGTSSYTATLAALQSADTSRPAAVAAARAPAAACAVSARARAVAAPTFSRAGRCPSFAKCRSSASTIRM